MAQASNAVANDWSGRRMHDHAHRHSLGFDGEAMQVAIVNRGYGNLDKPSTAVTGTAGESELVERA